MAEQKTEKPPHRVSSSVPALRFIQSPIVGSPNALDSTTRDSARNVGGVNDEAGTQRFVLGGRENHRLAALGVRALADEGDLPVHVVEDPKAVLVHPWTVVWARRAHRFKHLLRGSLAPSARSERSLVIWGTR